MHRTRAMRKEEFFNVLCLDASSKKIVVSWAVLDENKMLVNNAEVYYTLGKNNRNIDLLVPSIEHARTVVGGGYENLQCILCVIGPGSFTGLRNALSFTKGIMGISYAISAVGIRSHDVMAFQYKQYVNANSILVVANDARSKRYYTAVYEGNDSGNINYKTEIHDCTEEFLIHDITVRDKNIKRITCVGTCATLIAPVLQKAFPSCEIFTSPCTPISNAQAIRLLGLHYLQTKMHAITQYSQPLYIRAAV